MLPAPTRGSDTKHPNGYKRNFRWWHEAIIDDMLVNPKCSLTERAARLGYKPAYLSMLINSDMFRAIYAERRAKLKASIDESISKKMSEVVELGLDVMKEKLTTKRSSLQLRDLAEMNNGLLDRLGYGVKSATPQVQVNVNNGTVGAQITPDALEEARRRLREVEQSRAAAASAQVVPPRPMTYLESDGSASPEIVDVTPTPEAG